jgi:hypothetical protein
MCDSGAAGKLLDVRLEALHEHVKQFHSNAPRDCASGGSISFPVLCAGAHAKVRGRIVGQDAAQQLQYALEHYSRCAQLTVFTAALRRELDAVRNAGRSCCTPCATRDRHTG